MLLQLIIFAVETGYNCNGLVTKLPVSPKKLLLSVNPGVKKIKVSVLQQHRISATLPQLLATLFC
jgi:hypothetical protein